MKMLQEVLLFGAAMCGFLSAGCRDDLQMADVVFRAECTIRSVQNSDGGWGGVRTTALAVMAYMSNDETLRSLEFRQSMIAAAEWLIKKTEADEIKPDDMPIAANALCALYEFLPNPNLRFAALKCLSSVVGAQQPTGMWKDMLTTGWAALALNNARHLGLRVAHDEEWMDKIPFETIATDGPDGAVASYLLMSLNRKFDKRFCAMQGGGNWNLDCGFADAGFFAARVLRCLALAPCDDSADAEKWLRVFRRRIECAKREMLSRMRTLSEGGHSHEDVERLCFALLQVSWPSCRCPRPDHQGRNDDIFNTWYFGRGNMMAPMDVSKNVGGVTVVVKKGELLKAEDPGKRYVISAHAIPALLDECLGTKVSKMRWRSKDEALKLAECIRKEGGEAFFADNKHAGMIKRGYVDPYFPQEDSGSIWRLE